MELSIQCLTKHFGKKIAVDCVSAKLGPGVYGLLGANGAGKTTLMRMLCAILEPTCGQVCLDGKDVAAMGEAYRDVLGYLPQSFGYYPTYTAAEFLAYIAALKGIPRNAAGARVRQMLELLDLTAVADKKLRTFSGGMKQRVGIAQALLNDPQVLILTSLPRAWTPGNGCGCATCCRSTPGTGSCCCPPTSCPTWRPLRTRCSL